MKLKTFPSNFKKCPFKKGIVTDIYATNTMILTSLIKLCAKIIWISKALSIPKA